MSEKKEFSPLLAAGLHDMSLESIQTLCVEPFNSPRREMLFDNFSTFASIIRGLGARGYFWLDGSFLTEKHSPDDIDLVVELDLATLCLLPVEVHHRIQATVNDAKARYLCDAYTVTTSPNHDSDRAYWRGLFGFFRDERTPKGIARVPI